MQTTIPFLSLAIWTPILFGLVVLACGRQENPMPVRAVALMGAIISFLLTLPLAIHFEKMPGPFKFEEQLEWIPFLNASYHLGVDGISMWFIPLTALITI